MVENSSWVAWVAVVALILAVVAVAVVMKGSVTGEAVSGNLKNRLTNRTGNITYLNQTYQNNTWINQSIWNLSAQIKLIQNGEKFTLMNYTNLTKVNVSGYVCVLKNGKLVASSVPCK